MHDVNFDCPSCDQNIEAPVKMAGMKIYCPGCHVILQIPWPSEIEEQRAREQAKKETVRIDTSLGGIPPDPAKRRIVINRLSEETG